MLEPKDLTPEELRRRGLGLIERPASSGTHVRRAYCLRCGGQVASERRESDPDGWWICGRGCNTRFASSAPYPTDFPAPPARTIRRRIDPR
jgi:hypothetical protein